jgi:hypothetical protein
MKEMFQRIFAVVFAICVVSPACCCAFSHETGNSEVSSCCGGNQSSDPEHDCGCSKMEAATEWKAKEAISSSFTQLPVFAGSETISLQVFPEISEDVSNHEIWIDTGPPTRRRALLQCFLI